MLTVTELFRQGRHEELWQRCCGFIDLSLEEFMRIQKQLLLEQLELLKKCELGHSIMQGLAPRTVDEFRELVPLTTYDDYAPHLLKRHMEWLPKKPILWQYTSGKSGEYSYRWVPVTAKQLDEIEPLVMALFIFATSRGREEINFRELDRLLYSMAPPPYATGTMARLFPREIFSFLPPLNEAEEMSFDDRIRKGFDQALSDGMDLCLTLSSVAVAIGNRLNQRGGNSGLSHWLKRPRAASRLAKGLILSKLLGRPLMPRDLWRLKGLITYGIDGSVYREKIKEMWGRYPLNFHGCTEAVLIAMQTWDYQDMTFIPHLNFFEFISEEESMKSWQDPTYKPKTYMMDELEPGNYELVITSFHGGPFVRYKLGHLVKITSLRNNKLDIDIPQMVFLTRVDDQIDIAGFTRLSEKIIWQAIENAGISYVDWTARKEVSNKPVLHLYVESKGNGHHPEEIATLVHEELKKLDTPYSELESFTGLRPLVVSLLPEGAFEAYKSKQQASGAELEHLKPPHINPSEEVIEFLLRSPTYVPTPEPLRVGV